MGAYIYIKSHHSKEANDAFCVGISLNVSKFGLRAEITFHPIRVGDKYDLVVQFIVEDQ